jgi:hypothetical protein
MPDVVFLDVYWDKNLKTFAPCNSKSPPPADFTPSCGFPVLLQISIATTARGWGIGFVYIISLFIFESSIVLSLITFINI